MNEATVYYTATVGNEGILTFIFVNADLKESCPRKFTCIHCTI